MTTDSRTTLNVLIVDDESLARRRLQQLLSPYGDKFITFEAENGFQALDLIQATPPDLVFLDIEMPKMSGFQLLQQIEKPSFQVVFQTAYAEFAVDAFAVNACDYLLKPVTPEAVQRAVERALSRLASGKLELDSWRGLLQKQNRENPLRRFVVKAGSKSRVIEEDEVEYFSSREHVSYIHLREINFSIDLSLNALSERLDPQVFLRIHRNSIVKINEIASFTTGAEMTLTLKNGQLFKVARDRHKDVKAAVVVNTTRFS